MGLKETAHDLERSLDDWHVDLQQINNALDRARTALRTVKDKSTAESSTKAFEVFNDLLGDLSKEAKRESDKFKSLIREAENSSAKPAEKPVV